MSHIEHLRKHANWYARRGLRVFPCKPRDKVPATAHGCKDATTAPAQIGSWWDGTYLYNVGLATGGGLVVLDVDNVLLLQDVQAPFQYLYFYFQVQYNFHGHHHRTV